MSRPQLPRSRLSFSGMSWVLAIFTEIGSNFAQVRRAAELAAARADAVQQRVVSRAPTCRISIRARNSRARSRTRSRKSIRSSALKNTVTRRRGAVHLDVDDLHGEPAAARQALAGRHRALLALRRSRYSPASASVASRTTRRKRRSRLKSGSGRGAADLADRGAAARVHQHEVAHVEIGVGGQVVLGEERLAQPHPDQVLGGLLGHRGGGRGGLDRVGHVRRPFQ